MSVARYDIIKDYFNLSQGQDLGQLPDSLSLNAYWVVVVFPFKEEVTFQRSTMSSYDPDPSQAVKTSGEPMVITSDCHMLQVNTNKGSFQGGLQAQLRPGNIDYTARVFPGDWCLAWMLQSETQAKDLLTRIHALDPGNPCNNFLDGLKFIGRVQSCRKTMTQNPGGPRTAEYSLQAKSFSEFEAEVFFDPNLSEAQSSVGNFFAKLTQDITGIIGQSGTGVKTQEIVPYFLTLLLGKGIPTTMTIPGKGKTGPKSVPRQVPIAGIGLSGQDPGVPDEEAPYAYLVPEEVGALLGKVSQSKTSGILSAADLDECVIGVQNFSQAAGSTSSAAIFTPDNVSNSNPAGAPSDNPNHKFTKQELLGTFLPSIPDFTGEHSVWTILYQYVNTAVNEMYTALRANENGEIVPTLVIRQIPLTSEVFYNSTQQIAPADGGIGPPSLGNAYLLSTSGDGGVLPMTRFLELPRWHIHPLMFISSETGRSESKRFNFVHTYGQAAVAASNAQTMTAQIVANPPIQDLADIKRSGLHPHMSTVACNPRDIFRDHGAAKWMALSSDWLMGMHLTFDGTFNVHGIQAPIVPGDNIEFDNIVYHIESVLHSCTMSDDGKRAFYTTLQVSHGVRGDTVPLNTTPLIFPDQGIYADIYDRTAYDPGFTYDAQSSEGIIAGNQALVHPLSKNPADVDEVD